MLKNFEILQRERKEPDITDPTKLASSKVVGSQISK